MREREKEAREREESERLIEKGREKKRSHENEEQDLIHVCVGKLICTVTHKNTAGGGGAAAFTGNKGIGEK